ncbi:MAG: TRC40/GET3/ArsA family transport-energizing ATPase [Candidatus Methanoperedens sp.]|uniref:arsenical pump-driving ATPase n=1 Tax=Candidatus Methanoperedens sp. BLZ2 TaxID=2035255 RepID=UPI001C3E945E|nr:arsenical pump-driving ATPase [Candidatus Methanoperedens sp. BLZ2]MBZ0176960.1 TRC40/GET3/ArsA family transport-energizing ATPase [Candidatus Methanoperedens nitroreducens]MCX9078140.1 TRC40/GET3/ArsA family transport-energizing ATPase [Candidatus Methanoperedens sp.]
MTNQLIEPQQKGETKFVFFSGKGGVGKSTMSCTTAVWLAKKGYKTLLVTTDPAPNLSDIFTQEIGHKITSINNIENLFAIEINPDTASEEYRERIIAPMRKILDEKNIQVINEQMNSPCVEEVAAFDKFIEFMDDPQYDVVIFDTAPTGHTIRLLELPGGWSTTLEKSASTCIGPGASLQNAKSRYEKAISYLQDDAKTSFIFVLKPESSSLLETKRSSDELSKLGIKINILIINGILPEEACTDEFFKKKKVDEQKIVKKINETFPAMQKLFYQLRDSEVSGLELLEAAGKFLYEAKIEDVEIEIETELELSNKKGKIQESGLITDQSELYDLLTPLNGTRYIFFTGKGGVGKSTIACATSLYLAEKGFRTLILTTDPASHLQDIFGQTVEHEPTRISGVDNLYAARIDQKKALEEYKKRILDIVKDNDEETKKSVEEDLNSPCAQEMAAFERFINYFELNGYDIIIFDTAPTGHTLRLLELPSDWKGFIDLGDLTKKSSDETETKNKYANVIETMKNKEKSTFVFVMYPEYTPIIEAWRASEELKRQVKIETALVAVNYLLPQDFGKNKFFSNRRKQQEKYLSEIKQRFKTPMLIVPLLEREPEGLDKLRELGRTVFSG